MKKLSKILIWTVIALITQHGIFLYLENVYCSTNITTKAEKIEAPVNNKNNKMEIEIKPEVDNVTMSSDGRFVAYLDKGKLKVLDSRDNTEKQFENIYNTEGKYEDTESEAEKSKDSDKKQESSKNNQKQDSNKDTEKKDNKKNNISEIKPDSKRNNNSNSTGEKTESNQKKNENINESTIPNKNANGSGNVIDKSKDEVKQIPNTENHDNTNGPWNEAGPWNDTNKSSKPGTGNTDGPWNEPTSESKNTVGKNISNNTINVNPMLLINTNVLGTTEFNSMFLTKTNETTNENSASKTIDAEIAFYKWLPNEDNMIIIRKIKENNKYYFEPISFDAKKGITRELADFDLNKIRIELQNSEDKVEDVAFSTSTHSLYIKIRKSNGNCSLYYVNVMNQLERVKYNTNIGKIIVPTTSANAIIEEDSKILMLNKDNIVVPNVENAKILGVDSNDNVYFGEEVNGKINKIHYTILSDENRKWNEFNLKEPVEKDNIIIDYSGKVYINSTNESSVLELTTNKVVKYSGTLLQSYSKGIVSKSDNKILKSLIEK